MCTYFDTLIAMQSVAAIPMHYALCAIHENNCLQSSFFHSTAEIPPQEANTSPQLSPKPRHKITRDRNSHNFENCQKQMSMIDDFIQDEIHQNLLTKHMKWMDPIVVLRTGQVNPFLTPDLSPLITDPALASHPIIRLFCEPGCEMSIDFPEESLADTKQNRASGFLSAVKSIAKLMTLTSRTMRQSFKSPFNTLTSSGFFSQILHEKPSEALQIRSYSFEVSTFKAPFRLVEPFVCSAFLYSSKESCVISEMWNFVPLISEELFTNAGMKVELNLNASFQMDPEHVNEGTFVIMLISHPITQKNGAPAVKYYGNPTNSNEQNALKKIRQSFPRVNHAFTTFAWTFIEFAELRLAKGEVDLPAPFLIEGAVAEKDISDLLEDAVAKKFKQIPLEIKMKRITDSPMIVRPISMLHSQPMLYPVHQLVVQLKGLSLKLLPGLKSRNLLLAIEVRESENGKKLQCIHSKLEPSKLVETEYSRCYYHDRSPSYDDIFVINLPLPCPKNANICFSLYHVHVKQNDSPKVFVGRAVLPIYQKFGGLAIKDGPKTLVVDLIQNGKQTTDKANKLTVTTFLRSTFLTSEPSFLEFLTCGSKFPDFMRALKKIPEHVIVTNMMLICDQILAMYDACDDISFEPFQVVRDACVGLIGQEMFVKYMMIYVKYFAFRQANSKEAPISLHEHVHKRTASKGGIQTSMSLILLPPLETASPDLDLDPIPQMQPVVSLDDNCVDSLIDFNIRSSVSDIPPAKVSLTDKILAAFTKLVRDGGLRPLEGLIDFVAALLIKALGVSKTKDLGKQYENFLIEYVNAIALDPDNAQRYSKSFGLLMNLLFDIGLCCAAAYGIKMYVNIFLDRTETYETLVKYLEFAFRPNLFLYSIRYIDDFASTVTKIIQTAIKAPATSPIQKIFGIFLQVFSCYDQEMSAQVASRLIDCIVDIRPSMLPATSDIMTHIAFFNFLIEFTDKVALQRIVDGGNTSILFNLCHFILTRVTPYEMTHLSKRQQTLAPDPGAGDQTKKIVNPTTRPRGLTLRPRRGSGEQRPPSILIMAGAPPSVNEIVGATHSAMFKFASNFLNISDLHGAVGLIGFTYHMLNLQMNLANYPVLFRLIADIVEKFAPRVFEITLPCWVRIITRLLSIGTEFGNTANMAELFVILFDADLRTNKNNNRMTVITARSLSLLAHEQLLNQSLAELFAALSKAKNPALLEFCDTFETLKMVAESQDNKMCAELRADYLMYRLMTLHNTPDGQFETLRDLERLHERNNNQREIIDIKVVQAAIVLEYLVITRRISTELFTEHPAVELAAICFAANSVICPTSFMKDLPIVPGWATAPVFSELGFIALAHQIIDLCITVQYYEPAAAMLDMIWPMLERRRLYGQLENVFALSTKVFQIADSLPPHNSDAMEDVFFRVEFFGEVFGVENEKTFIYCEKRLTHLYDFSRTLVQNYRNVFGEDKIQLLTGDGEMERNPDIGYIRITHASPYYGRKGAARPAGTTLGMTTHMNHFFCDTPFVKGEKKLQGSVENQWIRRTLLTSKFPLPSIVCRSQVPADCIQVIEYEPIRVAYRAIRDRVHALQRALDVKDWPEVGQLLHGSLLAQVNEGPAKIAEVFLTRGEESKQKQKVRFEFSRFSSVLIEANRLHSEWVTYNPEFIPLQVQLDSSLEHFLKMLSNFIDIPDYKRKT